MLAIFLSLLFGLVCFRLGLGMGFNKGMTLAFEEVNRMLEKRFGKK